MKARLKWFVFVPAVLVVALFALGGARAQSAPDAVYTLRVDGLACPFCAYGVEKQLSRVEGVKEVVTDLKTGSVTVTVASGAAFDATIARRAVEAAGFTLRGFAPGRGTGG
jgi:mercuric ion binding protein